MDLGFSSQYSYAPLSGGTVSFSAPEQFSDGCDGDVRADVYSLGKVLEVLAPGRFGKVVRKATAEKADDRYASPATMIKALQPNKPVTPLLAALLLLSLIGLPMMRRPQPAPAGTPVRDTLYIRDTTRTMDTVVILSTPAPTVAKKSPQELFRLEVRKEAKRQFDPFYESYTHLTGDNFEEIQNHYLEIFESVRQSGQALAGSWADKYPDLTDEFGTIAMDELLQVIRRFQNDLMELNASGSGTCE